MQKVGCIVNLVALLVGFLGGLVLKVDLSGVTNKNRATSGIGLQVIIGVSLCVSDPCTLNISCETIYKLA